MRDSLRVKGMVTVRVLDGDGQIKRRAPGLLRRVLGLPGKKMEAKHHNIVTRQGDALIADALMTTQARPKVQTGSGYIQVGTGWTGNGTKQNTRCNTPAGSMSAIDGGYPALQAAWGEAGDATVTYRATFAAGSLNANGINEACLLNGNGAGADCLAYAQITPGVNITGADTLQILWEITIQGQ